MFSPQIYEAGDAILARARKRIFFLVVAIVLVAGCILTVLQPRVFRSMATVLMTAPAAIDEEVLEASAQAVAIQRRVLLGSDLLIRLSARLQSDYGISRSPETLRAMLTVDAVPETHLLELAATGTDAQVLPRLVDAWITEYTVLRSIDVAARRSQTLTEVEEEAQALAQRLAVAREELDQFRAENEIISIERQENAVLARLDGLNTALNAAIDEEVRARARLATLRDSLAAGEQVVPDTERSEVAAMADELGRLRARLSELRVRYTDDYIRKDPRLRELPTQIADLEAAIGRAYSQGSTIALDNAERELQTAQKTVADLQQRLEQHKAEVAAFNSTYARHAAMVEDLARLEELHREARARLAQVEVRRVDKYPQLSVIDPPALQARRIGPPYGLWFGGVALASLSSGVFAVWLHGYLNPRRREPALVAVAGVPYDPDDRALSSLESKKMDALTDARDKES